jgi:hypothetical protein
LLGADNPAAELGLESRAVALICEGDEGSATAAASINSRSSVTACGSVAGFGAVLPFGERLGGPLRLGGALRLGGPLRREGGGGAADGIPEVRDGGAGAGIPGPNGIVLGGGNGALILPTDGAEADDRLAAAPSVGADSWLRSSLMTDFHPTSITGNDSSGFVSRMHRDTTPDHELLRGDLECNCRALRQWAFTRRPFAKRRVSALRTCLEGAGSEAISLGANAETGPEGSCFWRRTTSRRRQVALGYWASGGRAVTQFVDQVRERPPSCLRQSQLR